MRNLVKQGLLVTCLATLTTLAACGGDKPPQEPSAMNTTGATTPPMNTAPMPESRPPRADTRPVETATPTSTPPEPARPAEKMLTDAEIVMITSTANQGEIEMAQLAAKNASSPEVKNFAAMMLTQHRDMETKGKALATKAKITPADSDAAAALKTDASSTVGSLKAQKGKDFDKAYIDSQVKAHREVLSIIDSKLLPNAQNGELKAQLTEARGHVAAHLAKAEEIQQKLDSGQTTTPAKPMPKR